MIFFVAGASGSGKSTIIPYLKRFYPNSIVHDFDAIGVPLNPDKVWRQQSTDLWLQRYAQENSVIFFVCGQVVLGEILACPSVNKIEKINFCLLDVSDIERVCRLRTRNIYNADQNMLNWASWLRMHHYDPQWYQNVIKDNAWKNLDFSTWDTLSNWQSVASIITIDTTEMKIDQVGKSVINWITMQTKQSA